MSDQEEALSRPTQFTPIAQVLWDLCQKVERLETDNSMANECLDMIRETMEALSGENAKKDGICPMFYPEWIKNTFAKKGIAP